SGWTAAPEGGVPGMQIRRIGDVARLRGRLSGTLTAASTTTVATIPEGFRAPTNSNFNMVGTTAGFIGWCNVTAAGAVSVHIKSPYTTGATVLEFTSVSFTYN